CARRPSRRFETSRRPAPEQTGGTGGRPPSREAHGRASTGRTRERPRGHPQVSIILAAREPAEHPPLSRRAPVAFALRAAARRGADTGARAAIEPDLARALDDRIRLRQLMEALRARLSARELQAASLCYLQGLPRAQAAAQMGVSEAAMRRLMDGRGGRSGV